MSEQTLPPAQDALRYYRRYRELYPLPTGWTETVCGGVRLGWSTGASRILLENDTHFLDLRLLDCHEPGDAYACVVRRDRRLPSDDEATALAAQLLGPDTIPMPYARVTVTYGCDGRPRDYHLAEPPFPEPGPRKPLALELTLRYPPER